VLPLLIIISSPRCHAAEEYGILNFFSEPKKNSCTGFRFINEKFKRANEQNGLRLGNASERARVQQKVVKKTEFSSRRRHSFCSALLFTHVINNIFFCVELKRERCLLNDFLLLSLALHQLMIFFLPAFSHFRNRHNAILVLSKFSITIKRERRRPLALMTMTACNTSLAPCYT
jgi:hypothetical protein